MKTAMPFKDFHALVAHLPLPAQGLVGVSAMESGSNAYGGQGTRPHARTLGVLTLSCRC